MGYLSNDEFFSRLAELFTSQKGKEHGAIYLSQRSFAHDGVNGIAETDTLTADDAAAISRPLIIRANNGKSKSHRREKVRLSTLVLPGDLGIFYARYAETCKVGMTALKPRDKSKKKAKAKKKKAATAAAGPLT